MIFQYANNEAVIERLNDWRWWPVVLEAVCDDAVSHVLLFRRLSRKRDHLELWSLLTTNKKLPKLQGYPKSLLRGGGLF